MSGLVIRHKTPCSECPWRKKSVKGYLGGNTVEAYALPVRHGVPVPCHMSGGAKTTMCAGSAIVMQNSCTVPRDDHQAKQIDKVRKSRDVFQFVTEFERYHGSDE